MYQVYVIDESAYDSKKLIGEFGSIDNARIRLEKEFAKDAETKYVIEQTTGHVDGLGNLVATVFEEN